MSDTETIKAWNREQINALLLRSDAAVERALVLLFDRQTADEQQTEHTQHRNSVGFSSYDAEIMSSLAKQVCAGRLLSQKQLAIVRRINKHGICRLARYWNQLNQFIAEKQKQVSEHVVQVIAPVTTPARPIPARAPAHQPVMNPTMDEESW